MSDEVLGDLTAARTRNDEEVHERLAALLGLPARRIRVRLYEAHGKTLVRTVFADQWPVHPDVLGELRLKLARDAGLFAEIARVTGLTERTVRHHVDGAHGAGLVKKLFARDWPSTGGTDEDDDAPAEDDEEEADDDEEDPEDDEEDPEEEDEREEDDEEAGEEARVAAAAISAFRVDPHGAWSRPRMLSRVFQRLGMDVPQRLRTPRFQEALQRLAQVGLEMRLADNEDDAPLTLDVTTPGIRARVCLRVAQAGGPRRQVATHQGRATAPRAESSPPPPIVVVPEAPRPAPAPRPQPREPGHEMAHVRLQFLTAVPSMDRQHDPAWPDQYLDAATAGLEVTDHERRHLRMLAVSYVRGHHSPSPVITRLIKTETSRDLDMLVEWFRHLNRSAAENAEEIVQWVQELRVGQPRPAPAPLQAPTPAPVVGPAAAYAASPPLARPPRVTTMDAPRPASATSKQGSEEAPANVRSLGALDDMFKD